MKGRWLAGVIAAVGIVLPFLARPKPTVAPDWVVLISGNSLGYLSPCGCVKPMTGGLPRRATALKGFGNGERTLVLETGGWVKGTDRQQVLKAETQAEAVREMAVDAVALTGQEARLGLGSLLSLRALMGRPWLAGDLTESDWSVPWVRKGPFSVTARSARVRSASASLSASTASPTIPEGAQILLLDGDLEAARTLAQLPGAPGLIVYRASGEPEPAPIQVGASWLVSPGDRGKALIRLEWDRDAWATYQVLRLGPELADDPVVRRRMDVYLGRVREEKLLEKLPRRGTEAFAGNARCISCHQDEGRIWSKTDHAQALRTLEAENHDRDPDCVSCHVVGLDRTKGFRNRVETPQLANVGCESCHGAGADHAAAPAKRPMPKIGETSCAKCHVPDHSPGFDFITYWGRIAHGGGGKGVDNLGVSKITKTAILAEIGRKSKKTEPGQVHGPRIHRP